MRIFLSRSTFLLALLTVSLGSALGASSGLRWTASAKADSEAKALNGPRALACGSDALAVADEGGRVVVYDVGEGTLTPRAVWTVREATNPIRMRFTDGDELLLLSLVDERIVRVDASGKVQHALRLPRASGGRPVVPRSFAWLPGGEIVLLDAGSRSVVWLDEEGGIGNRVALPPGASYVDVAVSTNRTLLVAGAAGTPVVQVDLETHAAEPLGASSPPPIELAAALAVAPNGAIFVLDRGLGSIWALRADGAFGERLLEYGWDAGQLRSPADVCADRSGNLFVADRDNRRVQMFAILD